MAGELAIRVEPGTRVDLGKLSTAADGGLDKKEAQRELEPLLVELNVLQDLMWGAQTHALLVVLQGRDAAGKDGVINRVFTAFDPQGLQITGFKVPTEEEAARDFLWRVHAAVPRKGVVGVFNRSHYEEVLVVKVRKFASEEHIEAAYERINDFERLLTETGTIVVKFCLHLGFEEQRKQLLQREEDPVKAWKLSPGDWAERKLWDGYTAAYAEALSRCSTQAAPWYVVPADRKWAAQLGVARVLAETLRPYREEWLGRLTKLQAKKLKELAGVEKL